MNPLWKVYKSKVIKTFNSDAEEDSAEEVTEIADEMIPVQPDEGPSAVTQLAKRMQGVSTKGWKSVTSFFNKDDEHQLLDAETESQPVADHPLAVKPEEPTHLNKRNTGFWDTFSTKWQRAAAAKQAGVAESGEEGGGVEGRSQQVEETKAEADEGEQGNSFSRYASLGEANEDAPAFKWNFVTNKLAELKSKSMTKAN